jgi:hypothetical protein
LSDEALSLIPSVDSIRRQLDPIRTRRALAASYGREAFHVSRAPTELENANAGAIKLAYALRWLELGPD